MEIAGVVLGAVPVILYALDNYERAWDPAKDFWNWGETIGMIRDQIFLQKQQLDTTLKILGLQNPTMEEIEAALLISHPNQVHQFMDIIRRMDNVMNEVAKDLCPDSQGPMQFADPTDRASWQWRRVRRSFGKKKRNQLFSQLHMWNTALLNCGLEKREVSSDSENRVVNLVRKQFDDDKTKTIRENVQALHEAIKRGLRCSCYHAGNFRLDWHDNKPYAERDFLLALSTDDMKQGHGGTLWNAMSMSIDVTSSPATSAVSLPSMAASTASTQSQQPKKKSVRILGFRISTRKLRHSKGSLPISPQVPALAVPSRPASPTHPIQLCDVLQNPQSGQSPLGWIPIPGSAPAKKVRIVAKNEQQGSSEADRKRVIHLHSLLTRKIDTATNQRLALHRKQRFGIAAALSWAVLHLCDSPWLGTTLDTEDINMFLENGSSSPILSTHPYLSHNFQPQTSSAPLPMAPTGSQIPPASKAAQFQSNQIRNMTLFTFAIRLIELGRNLSFEQIRQEYHASSASTLAQPQAQSAQNNPTNLIDDFEVAEYQIRELYLDPGKGYADAVDRCLRFLFPGPANMNTFQYKSFRSTFFADVVAPIQATYELIPGSCASLIV
ncbi:hypothetical protein BCR34DRAFT_13749 [Clohesyomyces aquaticus]|uniref:DUF7580 domain-containing protein n=1 Tax=Clohesyomyces aquaticus TaxID=1231657 RepID=A0A1Y1ZD42_9PLEO|nr:hypothetical protein BCR34DRAFT_13749 [Clohesyomyces aquaticus]